LWVGGWLIVGVSLPGTWRSPWYDGNRQDPHPARSARRSRTPRRPRGRFVQRKVSRN